MKAGYYGLDKKSLDEVPLTLKEKAALKILKKKVKGTDIEILLKESGLIK